MTTYFEQTRTPKALGGLKAVGAALRAINGKELRVGSLGAKAQAAFFDRKANGGAGGFADFSVATLVHWHEFGLGVPERPFLRQSLYENRAEFAKVSRKITYAALRGKVDEALHEAGREQVERVRAYLMADKLRPLAASTQEDTGRDSRMIPLVDTTQIYESIAYQVK